MNTCSNRLRQIPNIILCGQSGCGKTTLGRTTAQLLGFGFLDLDQEIEALERQSINHIFSEKGEAYFRQLETTLLSQLDSISNHVITVGGGAVANKKNFDMIANLGVTIWLHCDSAEIARRLCEYPEELKKRPLLADLSQVSDKKERLSGLQARLQHLHGSRQKFFEQANFYLNVSFTSPDEGARSIHGLLKKKSSLKVLKKLQRPPKPPRPSSPPPPG